MRRKISWTDRVNSIPPSPFREWGYKKEKKESVVEYL
jgi:hypothetical protein